MAKSDRTKKIEVDLARQVLRAFQSGEAIFTFDCVSGDEDHPTPTGNYHVLRKVNPCFSTEYKVPMNHALFFTNRGHAIHQAYAVGLLSFLKAGGFDYFGSHGCVRLSEDDATTLYDWADVGTPVRIYSGLSLVLPGKEGACQGKKDGARQGKKEGKKRVP